MVKKQLDIQYGPRVHLKGSTVVPGKWTQAENRKYLAFLTENRQKIQNKNLRREYRIYRAMSDKIPGRTSQQCRGHHRRMVQMYKSIDRIIRKLTKIPQFQGQQIQCQSEISIKVLKNYETGSKEMMCIKVQLNIDQLYRW